MHISSFLQKHGYECFFLDVALENDLIAAAGKINPDIIAYSTTTGKHHLYKRVNRELKERLSFFSLFGGPHCTFFPEFVYEEGIDAVCRGEGELATLELVERLKKKEDITGIKNLWLKVEGRVYQNEVRDLIEDLDALPFSDRKLFNRYECYKKMQRRFIMITRGCPYACTYCYNYFYRRLYHGKGRYVRRRSVENVIEELRFIKETYRPWRIQFWDDTFNLDHEWMFRFCEVYKRQINIPFFANFRVNLVNEEAVKAAKDAGCVVIAYGLESGNEYIRKCIMRRDISKQEILNAAQLINKYEIRSLSYNIVGLPDETLDTALETMNLNVQCKPTYALAFIFQPYPRTQLCEYAEQKEYFNGDINSIKQSVHVRSVMKMKDIQKMERLCYLFPLGAAFPILIPLIKILIKLPLNRLYLFLWSLYRAHCYIFGLKYITVSELLIHEERESVNTIYALYRSLKTKLLRVKAAAR